MESILELGISGIRGYSSKNHQKISFIKPLTLIAGKNGSGKTTIIECLKFITTGSLPPNCDKGKSFVLDPKMAGTSSVIGDLRLRLQTSTGRTVIVKRKIEVSLVGKQYKYSSLNQVLSTKDENGKEFSINHLCLEIDRQVPGLLGISRPVLENIVFCHQDASLWPFSDNNTLKSIFDELLDTKEFAKSMELIWDHRNEQVKKLKDLNISLGYEKQTHKSMVSANKKALNDLQKLKKEYIVQCERAKDIENLRKEIEDTQQVTEEREKLIKRTGETEQIIRNLNQRILTVRKRMTSLQRNYVKKSQNKLNVESNDFQRYSGQQFVEIEYLQNHMNSQERLSQSEQLLQSMKEKLSKAKQQLDQLKECQEFSKREIQLRTEINRIKEILPELRRIPASKEEEFIGAIQAQLREMEDTTKSIKTARQRIIYLSKSVPTPYQIDQTVKKELMEQFNLLKVKVPESSLHVLKVYEQQYRNLPHDFRPENIQNPEPQLNRILGIIQEKEQEVRRYKAMPKKKDQKTIQEHICRMNLIIELKQRGLEYAEQVAQCICCQKKFNRKQLLEFKKNTMQQIEDGEKAVEEFQRQKKLTPSNYIDPQIMVRKLTHEIQNFVERKRVLQKQLQRFEAHQLTRQQYLLNETLKKELQKCKLEPSSLNRLQSSNIKPLSNQEYKSMSVERFRELCFEFKNSKVEYYSIKRQINEIEDKENENVEILKKREQMIEQQQQISESIAQNEPKVRNLEIVQNIYRRLRSILQIKSKSNRQQQPEKSYRNVEQMESECYGLQQQIFEAEYSSCKLRNQIEYSLLFDQREMNKRELIGLNEKKEQLDLQLLSSKENMNNYNRMRIDYQSKRYEMESRLGEAYSALNTQLKVDFFQGLVKKKTLEKSIEEIENMYHTMEMSINEFHATKMDEINKIVYEIWKEIYHGDDIDYIEIETLTEKDEAKKRKKNFNYRIMMNKSLGSRRAPGSQRVEMKGRCSMGQKVLASIVVRLALAEVFTVNTSILALDEPTTNLDRQHIKNFAEQIKRLIDLSEKRKLELIIISHDLEFIRTLKEYSDEYYEVSRDEENFSIITRKSMHDLPNF